MSKLLSITLAAGLLLYPFATYAADYGSQTSQTQQAPPVAQTLVREGDFAIKLAAELDLGNPTNEAVAEDMLVKAGVAPVNGWISDYPVTPEILGQLQSSVAKAADEGKLPMNAEQATKGLYYLAEQMGLPTPAGSGTAATEGSKALAGQSAPPANPTVINNYYYDQGPPVVTYYPPPPDFVFLYDWVPYPVWWFGFWFPGFYICHTFTTVVVVQSRPVIVSNQIIDPVTRRVAVVEPLVRRGAGIVRPVTTLRTGNGRTFRTLTELRQEFRLSGRNVTMPRTFENPRAGRIWSPEARKSAQSIYSRSVERMSARMATESSRGGERRYVAPAVPRQPYGTPSPGGERRYVPAVPPERSYNGPVRGGERRYVAPAVPRQPYSTPWSGGERRYAAPGRSERFYNAPSWGGERPFEGAPARQFNGPVFRGGPVRSLAGGGWSGSSRFGHVLPNGGMYRGR